MRFAKGGLHLVMAAVVWVPLSAQNSYDVSQGSRVRVTAPTLAAKPMVGWIDAVGPTTITLSTRSAPVMVVTCLVLSSCMVWHSKRSPETYLADHVPGKTRITLTDGQVHLLESVRVKGDSLIGFETDAEWNGRRIAVSLDQVLNLEVREVDAGRTLLYAGGMVAFLALPSN